MVSLLGSISSFVSQYIKKITSPLLSTGVNGVINNNSGTALVANGRTPSVSGDYLVFNGSSTQLMYNRNNSQGVAVWTFKPPFSIEWDMKVPTRSRDEVIMTFGRVSSNNPYGELIIQHDAAGVGAYTQNSSGGVMSPPKLNQWFSNGLNGGPSTSPTFPVANQNYKYGLMCYVDGGVTYFRGYLDGTLRFQNAMTLYSVAANDSYGLSIGGTMDYLTAAALNGQIANLRMNNSLFWPI